MSDVSASISYRVPYADTDQMHVVYYANYLKYFEMARAELLRKLKYTYSDFERDGFALPVIEAKCNYKSPALFEDLIEITAFVVMARGVRVQISCQVKRGDVLLAEGYTIHACMDKNGKICKLPEQLMNILRLNGFDC